MVAKRSDTDFQKSSRTLRLGAPTSPLSFDSVYRSYIHIIENAKVTTAFIFMLIIGIIVVAAYGTTNPAVVGHTWGEMICDSNMCVNITSGRIGIGTMNPTQALSVSGDINISGTSYLNTINATGMAYLNTINATGTAYLNSVNATNIHLSTINATGMAYLNTINASGTSYLDDINASGVISGSGAGLTTLNASAISSGNIPIAHMPTNGSWALSNDLNIGPNYLHIDGTSGNIGIRMAPSPTQLSVNGSIVTYNPTTGDPVFMINSSADDSTWTLGVGGNVAVNKNLQVVRDLTVDGYAEVGYAFAQLVCGGGSCLVECPTGSGYVVSGGCSNSEGSRLISFGPTGNTNWRCQYESSSAVIATILCARLTN
jgi:hypothetical protein